MEKETRNIVNFWELPEEWQMEALRNFGSVTQAEENSYIEPKDDQNPEEHVLYDLSECFPVHDQADYNGIIGISNNSALALKFSDCMTQAEIFYL